MLDSWWRIGVSTNDPSPLGESPHAALAALMDVVFETVGGDGHDGLKKGAPSVHWLRSLVTRLHYSGVRTVSRGPGLGATDHNYTPDVWGEQGVLCVICGKSPSVHRSPEPVAPELPSEGMPCPTCGVPYGWTSRPE